MRKIYVSSTFSDLKVFRERVSNVIRRVGDLDVAMEHYAAEDIRPLERCLADVAACDVYVGIFAWRYGFVPAADNPEQRSITELEYNRAEELKKPRLIFLLHEDAPWPPKAMDKDRTQIERVRARASDATVVSFFSTPESLAVEVSTALAKIGQHSGTASTLATLNVEKYFTALRQRYAHLDLDALSGAQRDEFLQLRLQLVYVEQRVRENPPPVELSKDLEERLLRTAELNAEDLPEGVTGDLAKSLRDFQEKHPSRSIVEVLAEPENSRVIILGHPGSGKSTLSRYLVLSLIDPDGDPVIRGRFPQHLPIVIELKSYVALCRGGKCETFLDFLGHMGETEGWGLSKEAVFEYFESGQAAMVIFDGLDEIFEPSERETITRQIVGFATDYPSARIVATSRVLGYRRTILKNAGFVHLTLQDFEKRQVEEFARKWFALAMPNRALDAEERIARITRAYEDSASIRQLAGVPMLLTIMAIIGKNQELPRERWKLYDHAAGVLVQHWDINKHLKEQRLEADFLLEDDKKDLLRRLAWRMQSAKGGLAGNYIHRDELLTEFEAYLRERFGQDAERAARISREMVEQFRERNYILASLGASLYGFVHRAFLEYFCSDAIVYRFEKTNTLTLAQLEMDIFHAHHQDRAWHEVLRLVCGKIGEQFAGAMIAHLLDAGATALAIECLAEVRNISAVAGIAERVGMTAIRSLSKDPSQSLPLEILPQPGSFVLSWLLDPQIEPPKYPWSFASEVKSAISGNVEIHDKLKRLALEDGNSLQVPAIALLTEYLKDPGTRSAFEVIASRGATVEAREHACFALARYGDLEAAVFLERMSFDAEPDIRAAIVQGLIAFFESDPAVSNLADQIVTRLVLHDPDEGVRLAAMHSLGGKAGERNLKLLRMCGKDRSPRIRERARALLGEAKDAHPVA